MTIFTFYSYKGGVGRSMALANVAQLFYQAGFKVLMVDWDLEAPGLERFFPIELNNVLDHPGVIELLLGYKEQMSKDLLIEKGKDLPFKKPENFLIEIYPEFKETGKLYLLTAGRRSKEYFKEYVSSVLTFDWEDFYINYAGGSYFDWIKTQFKQIADIILIDSRTGITEMGGVCTYQLADVVVMFCAPNQQNIDGTQIMAKNLANEKLLDIRSGNALKFLIVPARVEDRSERDTLKNFAQE
jgi:MinD-like ATPase involved in chromosome partitioning or flagellar assembly